MNYLYVSHPIFINLYNKVCGFTGTIGNKIDKKILMEQYKIYTKSIPRNRMNRRVEFPILLCNNVKERNQKIVSEIIKIHENDNPVLVIFQFLNEFTDILFLLNSHGIKNVNIFDGKDEKIRPDKIAGLKGAISLGTNVCGRGTNILLPYKSLHVIVTYYTSNTRVMQQAFGRTARQGQDGTVHIICLKNEYFNAQKILNQGEISNILDEYNFKRNLQVKFIEKFRSKRSWIFEGSIKNQKLSRSNIEKLRKTKINVNRLVAFNFEYPICLSYQTFMNIQAQKIFSLFNCPNCKYTWMLFQKYLREMILESWSLFVEKAERKYTFSPKKNSFSEFLISESKSLYDLMLFYLPDSDKSSDCDVIPTFMHIFDIVVNSYESKIMNIFPNDYTKLYKKVGARSFCSLTFGFKPFSLIDESGARISILNGNNNEDMNYIKDPELKYMQKKPKGLFEISITNKIDGIFNLICQKINNIIGSYIGLKFFLRRTLGGCEFGVCYNWDFENVDPKFVTDYNCLVDKDPIFLFTINVKSLAPLLAGILIIGLVYIASIGTSISEWISEFPIKLTKELIKEVAAHLIKSQIEKFSDAICAFLLGKIVNQVEKMKEFNLDMSNIFLFLLKIIEAKDFSSTGDKIAQLFNGKVIFKMDLSNIDKVIPFNCLLKIGILLMIGFASFMLNFSYNKQSIKYNVNQTAHDYNQNQNPQESLNKNINCIGHDKIKPIDLQFNENGEIDTSSADYDIDFWI